jgi:hypothetical protein
MACACAAPLRGEAEVFVNDKDGRFLQLRIERDMGGAVGRASSARVSSLPVAARRLRLDDAHEHACSPVKRSVACGSLSADPGNVQGTDRRSCCRWAALLRADVEGMAIHRGTGPAYLVVSSQGNDSYVVLDAARALSGSRCLPHRHQHRRPASMARRKPMGWTSRRCRCQASRTACWSSRTAASAGPKDRRTSSTCPGRMWRAPCRCRDPAASHGAQSQGQYTSGTYISAGTGWRV